LALALLAGQLLTPAVSHAALGRTFYVSQLGDDANSGTSPDKPWRTISMVNVAPLGPGDTVAFEGGATFDGKIYLPPSVQGTVDSPVTLTSYGDGRATIRNAGDTALYAYNTGGLTLRNLRFVGGGSASPGGDGINIYNDLPGGVKREGIRIDSIEVSDFSRDGIVIGGGNRTSGFRDVRLMNLASHDNGRNGVFIYGAEMYANSKMYVGAVRSYRNTGTPGLSFSTGSGILISSVDGGLVENSIAEENGALSTSPAGPAGIWAYDSNAVTIQSNGSYSNRTGSEADGLGFDFDRSVTNSVLQYNVSSGNDGAGYFLLGKTATSFSTGNVVRYNISENDGRKGTSNPVGGILVFGGPDSFEIYQNIVRMSPNSRGNSRAVLLGNWSHTDKGAKSTHFRNNILITSGGAPLIEAIPTLTDKMVDFAFQGNDYYAGGEPVRFVWGGAMYTDLAAWRAASGQEQLLAFDTGMSVDPRFAVPDYIEARSVENPFGAGRSYRLRSDSPLVNAGLDLSAYFGMQTGGRDYAGQAAPMGGKLDVGAFELQPPPPTPTVTPISAHGCHHRDAFAGGHRSITRGSNRYGNRQAGRARRRAFADSAECRRRALPA
jgi:hypothetical protein